MGAKTIKVVVQEEGMVLGKAIAEAGFEASTVARQLINSALTTASIDLSEITRVVAAGVGRDAALGADATLNEAKCAARGARHIFPDLRTVIDVGAEEGRAIRCDLRGKVEDVAHNEKCAAGAGVFAESMARALEIPIDELGPLSLQSTNVVPMNAQCAVFAESEVVSMIHDNVPKPDMARAVVEAIAGRIVSMVQKMGIKTPVALIGGLARNAGFVDSLVRLLQIESVQIPAQPEFCVALGAALTAMDEVP